MDAQTQMFLQVHRSNEDRAMTSRCTIDRKNQESSTFNEETGLYDSIGEHVYEGKCLVRPALRDFRKAQVGGQEVSVHMYDIRLPYNTEVEVLDVITVTKSTDSGLVGRHLVVRDVFHDEWSTVRKVMAEEVR